MEKRVFLYKVNESNDRDCVRYIEATPTRFECDHYFSGVGLSGACFYGGDFNSYKDITTILTEEEYNQLLKFGKDVAELGFGIQKGDARYKQGLKLAQDIQPIFDKLQSEENKQLFEKVQQEEKEYLIEEFDLDEEEIKLIWENYPLEYRDRSIVGTVWDNITKCTQDEAESLGMVRDDNERYFDYDKFGKDLLSESDRYLELNTGRVVSFMT